MDIDFRGGAMFGNSRESVMLVANLMVLLVLSIKPNELRLVLNKHNESDIIMSPIENI